MPIFLTAPGFQVPDNLNMRLVGVKHCPTAHTWAPKQWQGDTKQEHLKEMSVEINSMSGCGATSSKKAVTCTLQAITRHSPPTEQSLFRIFFTSVAAGEGKILE